MRLFDVCEFLHATGKVKPPLTFQSAETLYTKKHISAPMRAAGIPEYDGPRIIALRRFWTSLRSYALQDTHFDALGHKGGGCRIAQGVDPRSVREVGILDVFELIRAA